MQISFSAVAEQFVGHDLPGWEIEGMRMNQEGELIFQARQRFPGGEQIAVTGNWIVTLESGHTIVLGDRPAFAEASG